MAKDNHTGRKIAAGAVVVGVAAYVAGILTAPKSGKETRNDIKESAGKAKDEAVKRVNDMRGELDETIVKAKAIADKLNEKTRLELNVALDKAQIAKDKSKQVLAAVKAGEASDPELDKAVKQLKEAKNNLAVFLKK